MPVPVEAEGRSTRPSFADPKDVDAFVAELRRFERGEIDAEAWRLYRVQRGAYGQRQHGLHMLRVKLPQGVLDGAALRALADVGERYSRGFGHVTTRQNVQFHFVRLADLEPAMRRLVEAGVTTLAACGNTVRNVVACPHAGVSPEEVFDPTPYAEAVTSRFLRHEVGLTLPRKFKIGFEGCTVDHVSTPIHDLGFRARLRVEDGAVRRGFLVTVAGGTALLCASGAVLDPFLPAGEVLALVEAVLRVFHARGDRQNRKRNRLKFLVRDLGFETFRGLVLAELDQVREEGIPTLPFDPDHPPEEGAPGTDRPARPAPAALAARVAARPPRGPGLGPALELDLAPTAAALARFRRTNVRPQRQAGFSAVTVSLPQGDVTSAQLEAIAELSAAWGDGTVRLTSAGAVTLRWIAEGEVPALFAALAAAGLGRAGAGSAGDVGACPGAEACQIAVTGTRAAAKRIEALVREGGDATLEAPLSVRVSGCPNGCSQHHVAAIGLQGSLRKLDGRAVPQYFVLVGGGVSDSGATFGRLAAKIPARHAPEAVRRLVALYLAERAPEEAAGPFFTRAHDRAKAAIEDLEALRLEDAVAEDFEEP